MPPAARGMGGTRRWRSRASAASSPSSSMASADPAHARSHRCLTCSGSLDHLARELELEALEQRGNAARVHLERVALTQLDERLWVGLCHATEVDELLEEVLETGGGDDLQDAG